MKKIFHADFESDGLLVDGQPSDHPDQPLPLSVACVLDDEDGNTLEEFSTLIKPTRPIPDDVTAINGITFEMADRDGVPMEEAIERVAKLMEQADIISAFNIHFDLRMFKIACARMEARGEELRCMMETKTGICTMQAAAKFLGAGRFIKLAAAHERILGDPLIDAHDADADMQASRRIFYELRSTGNIPEPKSLARKVYDKPLPPK